MIYEDLLNRAWAEARARGDKLPRRIAEVDPSDRSGPAMRRLLGSVAVVGALALGVTGGRVRARSSPRTQQSRWVMVDWMMDSFFVFAGFALVAFIGAWKAGHSTTSSSKRAIPLSIEEEDYYTPEWAHDEEEWDE